MNTTTSLRRFLDHVAIITAVVSTSVLAGCFATASEPTYSTDTAVKIELGIKPDVTSAGPAILPMTRLTFVTFSGNLIDENGGYQGNATAVLEMSGLVARKVRYGGGEEMLEHSVDLSSLDICETYEVHNSNWAQYWQGASGAPLRHFVVTYCGVNSVDSGALQFECLAEDLNVVVLDTASFHEVVGYAAYRDAEVPADTEPSPDRGDPPYGDEEESYEEPAQEPSQEDMQSDYGYE